MRIERVWAMPNRWTFKIKPIAALLAFDGGLFDPPYSLRQVKECYDGLGLKVSQTLTQCGHFSLHMTKLTRVIRPGGKLISFGWNSNGAGAKRGFRKDRILLVAHGGGHNDTIVTVETKIVNKLKLEET